MTLQVGPRARARTREGRARKRHKTHTRGSVNQVHTNHSRLAGQGRAGLLKSVAHSGSGGAHWTSPVDHYGSAVWPVIRMDYGDFSSLVYIISIVEC